MTQRFFLDGRKLGDGGIGTFIETFITGLISTNHSGFGNYTLDLVVGRDFIKANKIPKEWEGRTELNIYEDNTSKYSLEEYFLFPLRWRNLIKKSSLYIAPHYTLPFFIPIKKLVVIHDLIQVLFPEKFIHKIIPRILLSSAINRANRIATVSNHSRTSILSTFRARKLEIKIIPNAVRSDFLFKKRNFNFTCPTFIYVGADRNHKQLQVFLEFLKIFKESGRDFRCTLVSKLKSSSLEVLAEYDLIKNISIYENISNHQLSTFFSSSDVLICTSAIEGFCLPLLEAAASGLPVICPDLDYSKELLGEAGIYFESGSPADIYFTWLKMERGIIDCGEKVQRGFEVASRYSPMNQFKAFLECV